jgi:hypothetical protein
MFPYLATPLPVSFVAFSERTQLVGESATFIATIPTEAQVGDLLLFFSFITYGNVDWVVTGPAGVTKVAENPPSASWGSWPLGQSANTVTSCFYRYFQPGDSTFEFSATDFFSQTFEATDSLMVCLVLRNATALNPILSTSYIGNFLNEVTPEWAASPISISCGNLPSVLSGGEIIWSTLGIIEAASTWTIPAPSGFTQIYSKDFTSALNAKYVCYFRTNTTGEPVGNILTTATRDSGTGGAQFSSFSITIKK